jgi:hypothetical protein
VVRKDKHSWSAGQTAGGGHYQARVTLQPVEGAFASTENDQYITETFLMSPIYLIDFGYCDDWKRRCWEFQGHSTILIQIYHFPLTAPTHPTGIVSTRMLGLLKEENFADITLRFREGKMQRAHKLILANRSPVFRALFGFKAQDHAEIDLPLEIGSVFVEYLYTGTLREKALGTWHAAVAMYEAANLYQIPPLALRLVTIIGRHLRPDNALQTFAIAQRHSLLPASTAKDSKETGTLDISDLIANEKTAHKPTDQKDHKTVTTVPDKKSAVSTFGMEEEVDTGRLLMELVQKYCSANWDALVNHVLQQSLTSKLSALPVPMSSPADTKTDSKPDSKTDGDVAMETVRMLAAFRPPAAPSSSITPSAAATTPASLVPAATIATPMCATTTGTTVSAVMTRQEVIESGGSNPIITEQPKDSPTGDKSAWESFWSWACERCTSRR